MEMMDFRCRVRRFHSGGWTDCGKGSCSIRAEDDGLEGGLVRFSLACDASDGSDASCGVSAFPIPPIPLRPQPSPTTGDGDAPPLRRWLVTTASGTLLSVTLKDSAAALRFRDAFEAAGAENAAKFDAATARIDGGAEGGVAAESAQCATRSLFGGAIVANVPPRFIDISSFRDVPDTQEVFCDEASEESIVIEVLEHQADVASDAQSLFNCWDDLCAANEAGAPQRNAPRAFGRLDRAWAAPHLAEQCAAAWGVRGLQLCSKSRAAQLDHIDVALVELRLPGVGASLVIHMNAAAPVHAGRAAAPADGAADGGDVGDGDAAVAACRRRRALLAGGDPRGGAAEEAAAAEEGDEAVVLPEALRALLASLDVRDWGLFG